MNFSSRIVKGALLAVSVAMAVSLVPAAGGAVDAGHGNGKNAILAIL